MWFSPEGGFNLGLYTDCFHWVRVRDFFEEPQPSLSEPDVFIHPEVPEGQNTVMQTKHGGIPAVEDPCVLTGSSVQKSCFQKVTMMDSKLTLTPAGRSSWMLTGYKARLPHCCYSCLWRPELSLTWEKPSSAKETQDLFSSLTKSA